MMLLKAVICVCLLAGLSNGGPQRGNIGLNIGDLGVNADLDRGNLGVGFGRQNANRQRPYDVRTPAAFNPGGSNDISRPPPAFSRGQDFNRDNQNDNSRSPQPFNRGNPQGFNRDTFRNPQGSNDDRVSSNNDVSRDFQAGNRFDSSGNSQQVTDSRNAYIKQFEYENGGSGVYNYKVDQSDGIYKDEFGEIENQGTDEESSRVYGHFGYPAPDGRYLYTEYVADKDGFRVAGDHIPQSASVGRVGQLGIPSAAIASLAGGGLG